MSIPSRESALALWRTHNDDPSLLRHAFAVEAAMQYWAKLRGGDPEEWALVGLVHDIDYGRYPGQHCVKAKEILEDALWPESMVRAVLSHGWGFCTEIEPKSDLEKYLYAVDELTGFIIACALVRPSKSLVDLEPRSIKKKWKEKGFAAGVDRAMIEKATILLGIDLELLIEGTLEGLKVKRDILGL